MKRYIVLGQKVVAHDKDCAENFREDRKHNIIYPAFETENGSVISWVAASIRYNFCVYCGNHAPVEVEDND